MGSYLFCFVTSLGLLMLSQRVKRQQQIYLIFIALLIPCILAGMRADSIGTDVKVYLRPMYNAAEKAVSFREYLNASWYHIYKYNIVKEYEFGFIFVVYIITKIFHSFFAVKFTIEFLILCPIYIALRLYCKETPLWVGMATYYFLFFNQSLNLMRQYVGISFLFIAIIGYLNNRKMGFYIIFQVMALLFHRSMLVGVVIFFIARYFLDSNGMMEMNSLNRINKRKLMIISISGVIVLLAFGVISKILLVFGLGRYIGYVAGELSFMPNQIIIRLPIFILCYMVWKKLNCTFYDMGFFMAMVIYTMIFAQFAGTSTFGARIAICFAFYQIVLIPRLYCVKKREVKTAKQRWNISIYPIAVLGYLVFYWMYFFVYLGMDATMPYAVM